MPDLSWIGTVARFRAFRFDKGWPTIELFRGDSLSILFAAKMSGDHVVLDDDGFHLTKVDLSLARLIFVIADPFDGGLTYVTKYNDPAAVTVTGGPLNLADLTITFGGTLALAAQPDIVVDNAGMIGGSILMTHTVTGSGSADDVQVLSHIGVPVGGSFTLTFAGQTTVGLRWNAPLDDVAAALLALPAIGGGRGITVTAARQGHCQIALVPADTATVKPGVYSCAVAMIDGVTAQRYTLARASLVLYRSGTEGLTW